jgi:tRNA(fMet)-specific endonuclease VapC
LLDRQGRDLHGIERLPDGKRRQMLAAKAEQIFSLVPCEPVPEAAGDYYARVKADQQRQGLPLDENDLWIAATALALGAVLVSRDSDLRRIDGLNVENWSA